MEQQQNDSPQSIDRDPLPASNIQLSGCPYLGFFHDPQTMIAVPDKGNYCHRLQSPVGVDVAHQASYCLSANHKNCYVYGREEDQVDLLAPEPETSAGLAVLTAGLSRFKLGQLDLGGGLKPLRGRFASLTAWRQSPEQTAGDESQPPANQPSEELQHARLRFEQFTLDRERLSALVARLDRSRLEALHSRLTMSMMALQTRAGANNTRMLGLFVLPLLLLLVFAAAVVWWPRPASPAAGISAVAAGEIAAVSEPAQPAAMGADRDLDGDDRSTSPEALPDAGLADDAEESQIRLEGDLAETAPISLSPADLVEEAAIPAVNAQSEAMDNPSAAAPSSQPGTAPVAASAAADADSDTGAPTEDSVSSENVETAGTAPDTEIGLPPPAMVLLDPAALDTVEDGREAAQLFLYGIPAADAPIVAVITDPVEAEILGRREDGEWLMVRLGMGLEGWVQSLASGDGVDITDLPVVAENVAVAQPGAETAPIVLPALADDAPAVGTMSVNTGALNLRAGPGTEYAAIGMVFNGQPITLLSLPSDENLWVQVRTADGLQGWMNSRYMVEN